ncbi:MAG: hypothetical protein KatS3mg010_1528 [Acidimicrobiia bacterium]|nr:MAG: hypothetical protein KatS3mg010_1528 [Acidimicrobiia bacterium]
MVPGWHLDALCREYPRERWFSPGEVEAAREVCRRCLVRRECLSWGLRELPGDGVWGGLTWQELRVARRQGLTWQELLEVEEQAVRAV